MQNRGFFRGVFLVAALYDLVLGLVFFFLYPWVYGFLGVSLPTEPAYLHATAAFVFVQGIMYYLVYRNLGSQRTLRQAAARLGVADPRHQEALGALAATDAVKEITLERAKFFAQAKHLLHAQLPHQLV